MPADLLPSLVVLLGCVCAASLLTTRRLRTSRTWRATLTPLASIIGSGFLVLAPLLVRDFGRLAVVVMGLLCAASYVIGAGIRANIAALDGAAPAAGTWPGRLEWASSWTLSLAYVISVSYYLNLFGAFAVSLTPWHEPWHGKLVTSAALLAIAAIGWRGGLRGLERAEGLSVGVKLAVIAGLLAGMVLYVSPFGAHVDPPAPHGELHWASLPVIFGLLITVQGFETSRYLGDEYDAPTRVRTMRFAQLISAAIYLLYIGLASLSFADVSIALSETAVIGLMAPVARVLPPLLVLAALAAQFSAAVADTNGCGGLVHEMSRTRVSAREAYLVLVAAALALTWSADIFRIISEASRAFAIYYALQMALAAVLSRAERGARRWRAPAFAALCVLMVGVALFGIPAE